jgi:transposase-like protein
LQRTGGRSNRWRFTDEHKRAMVRETEKPGVAGGRCFLLHGIAIRQLFRWRVQFSLTSRETPQLATMTLADGAVNPSAHA